MRGCDLILFSGSFLVIKDPVADSSRILVEPHLIDAEFRKPGCLTFVGLVILRFLLISFLVLLVIFCLNRVAWICLVSQGVTCRMLLVQKVYCRWSGWLGLE